MSLRAKTIIIVFALFTLFASLGGLVRYLAAYPRIMALERSLALDEIERSMQLLEAEVKRLDALCSGWSDGEATVDLLLRGIGSGEAPKDFDPVAFTRAQVNLIFLIQGSGRVSWGKLRGLPGLEELKAREFPGYFFPEHPFLLPQKRGDAFTGVIPTELGPILVSSRPLFGWQEPNRRLGHLVMGRLLSKPALAAIWESVPGQATVEDARSKTLPEPFRSALAAISPANPFRFKTTKDDRLEVFFVINDAISRPLLIVRRSFDREFFHRAIGAGREVEPLIFALGLIVGAVVLFLLRRSFLDRLEAIARSARRIAERGDPSGRLPEDGDDELAELAKGVNHMLAELERSKAMLSEQQAKMIAIDRLRALGEMATAIAHELNQPLMGVRGQAEHLAIGLEKGWDFSTDRIRKKLQTILEQSDRMVYIIEHVRKFARGARGEDLSEIDLNQVANSSASLLGSQLRAHGFGLELELAADLPPVLANPYSLEEVVINLVINARGALEDKKKKGETIPVPAIKIQTAALDQGRAVELRVIDRGTGIDPAVVPHLFEPFFTTKGPDQGTGLGLSISRSIVTELGGTIRFEDTPGGGATAIVTLPGVRREA